ncbi:MAG: hypothetical protein PVG27_09260 [Chloroflexota bacterium]|jgi:hypothetical protein
MAEDIQLDDIVQHKELAEWLGISERSLAHYRIPRIEIGGQRLFVKQHVVRWLLDRERRGGAD